jgi:hypothetical protein
MVRFGRNGIKFIDFGVNFADDERWNFNLRAIRKF